MVIPNTVMKFNNSDLLLLKIVEMSSARACRVVQCQPSVILYLSFVYLREEHSSCYIGDNSSIPLEYTMPFNRLKEPIHLTLKVTMRGLSSTSGGPVDLPIHYNWCYVGTHDCPSIYGNFDFTFAPHKYS